MAENIYLLLNEFDVPVARGRLLNNPDAPQLQVKLIEGRMETIEELERVKLVGIDMDMPTMQGKVLRCANDTFILGEIISGAGVRETLRVSVSFDTLIYPVDGAWRGRRKVQFLDLSGGGVSFLCDEKLERGEKVEVVIPITPEPLVLTAQILRIKEKEEIFYAAKFVDLCYDEEKLVCEAVFAVQLKQHKQRNH